MLPNFHRSLFKFFSRASCKLLKTKLFRGLLVLFIAKPERTVGDVEFHTNHEVDVEFHPNHAVDVEFHPNHVVDVVFHPNHVVPSQSKLHFLTHQSNGPSCNNAYKAMSLYVDIVWIEQAPPNHFLSFNILKKSQFMFHMYQRRCKPVLLKLSLRYLKTISCVLYGTFEYLTRNDKWLFL